ncbi:DUF167 domain-containing protein [Patescibacteria group bacterium]|nr:DUF167 domain-containing protein [Patescibacteria group bacterium]MCL5797440.1 DUF167 domain-containing protein [Patescibacteria group bacterium]
MKINLLVKTKAKENRVQKIDGANLKVFVKAPPLAGKANAQIVEVLAKYFNCRKSDINIVSGLKSKKKIVEIL